uniref:Uncharacterized protein n=1 Tax=Coturnix japonica TaxID=93934 RepID=A0A8C2T100_COTJA
SLCQCLHQHQGNIPTHPEVLGVHMQLVTVQLGQLGEGVLDVVQVLHGIPKGGEHFLAMGADHGVASDGGGTGQVPKGRKEPLGPGVDDQQPAERWNTQAHTFSCSHFHTQRAAEPISGPKDPAGRGKQGRLRTQNTEITCVASVHR